jgi:EmrB/QacA subfamily drug resistance transporter
VLAAAIIGSTMTFVDGTVVNVALPVLRETLGASLAQVQWVVEAYMLFLASLMLVGGALGDRWGRRFVFVLGIGVFSLASAACGFAGDVWQLIVARGVQGIGAALLVPGSLALISANFSKGNRGRAIGTWAGFTSIAAGIGPVLGGWLIEHVSWRGIFFLNIPLGVIVLAIVRWRVPESRGGQTTGGIDWLGAGLVTAGLFGVVFGLVEGGSHGFREPRVMSSLAFGAASSIAFVLVERRQRHPMVPLILFRSSTFAAANLLTMLLYFALGALMFALPFYLIEVAGYSAVQAAASFLPFVFVMSLLSRWSGGLMDRYGPKLPLTVGPMIAAVGLLLFARVGGGAYWVDVFPAVMVMSLGMSITVAPLTTTVMTSVDEHLAGLASGINNAVSRLASLLAVAIVGGVLQQSIQSGLTRVAWLSAALAAAAGVSAFLFVDKSS